MGWHVDGSASGSKRPCYANKIYSAS